MSSSPPGRAARHVLGAAGGDGAEVRAAPAVGDGTRRLSSGTVPPGGRALLHPQGSGGVLFKAYFLKKMRGFQAT